MNRIIGQYTEKRPGPLILLIAGMHGNEHAGIEAAKLIFKMLEVEHITNPSFQFRGSIVAMYGNIKAIEWKTRYVDKDLNRIWHRERIDGLLKGEKMPQFHEEHEMLDLINHISSLQKSYIFDRMVIMDLHTTSAPGGIFVVPSERPESQELAMSIHAPVIRGMIGNIEGAALKYFDDFSWDIPTAAISFESGQHDDPQSIYVAIAAIVNLLRSCGSVNEEDVESIHQEKLSAHSRGLPRCCILKEIYKVKDPEKFQMFPGFTNFQFVKEGTPLALDHDRLVHCPYDAYILMPLYQKKGFDGYFLVEHIRESGFFE